MCGIIGFSLANHKNIPVGEMLAAIKHRGPDDQGYFVSEDGLAGIGQVRLSILDLTSSGHQPMFDASGRYAIIFNGEVYNYTELKRDITDRYGFNSWSSRTDTEVVVEGYAREGYDFIERLNGIFSLCILDRRENSIYITRDPIGVKPFYYTEQDGGLYFASEMKALLPVKDLQKTLRIESVADQLSFMYVPEPYTMFREFFKLIPGEYRVYRNGTLIKKGSLRWGQHFPCHLDRSGAAQEEMIDYFRQCFYDATKRQLMADVPVSVFLSGGLDSSSVLAAAVKHGGIVNDAYTIAFSKDDMKYDSQSDDLHYARRISDRFGIPLNVIEADPDMFSLLPEVVFHLDDALADPAAINTYVICKAAREHGVKVMLSGQGADELFGGYRKYRAETIYRLMPEWAKKAAGFASTAVPAAVSGGMNAPARRLRKFLSTICTKEEERVVELAMWNRQEVINELFVDPVKPGLRHREAWKAIPERDPVKRMMHLDQQIYMPSHNLMYTDKMSMMAGVEARVPFLDLQVVSFARSLPLSMMLKNGQEKYIIKKAMRAVLPREIIHRSKAGFGAPIRSWFRKSNANMEISFDKERLRRQGIFKADKVYNMLQENYSGRGDHSYTLFALLNFQIWWDIFIEGKQIYS